MRLFTRALSGLVFSLGLIAPVWAGQLAEHVVLISVDGLPASLINKEAAPLDAIRSVAKAGVEAEWMIVSNPSVTWPNHTTLLTGARPVDHGVLFNGVLERQGPGLPVRVNPKADKTELVLIPTLADALHEQGKSVAGINWPCTRNSPAFLIDFPDVPDMLEYTTPSFIEEMIEAGIVPSDIRTSFGRLPALTRDRIWTQAACLALKKHQPALTVVHLLNLDAVHHRYGPETVAGYTAMAFEDTCVRQILDTLDETGLRDKTAVLIVSDHGFMGIPKTLHPNVQLRKAGLLTVEGNQITAANVHIVPEGGIAMVYLTRSDTRDADRQKVIDLFKESEGIVEVLTPDKFLNLGFPQPDEYPQMADLVLVAKDGYGFSGTATGDAEVTQSDSTLGTHGFLSTNPRMNATFVAAGAGIRPGVKLGVIENTQVAPTIAELLGVELKAATGKPLNNILLKQTSAAK